MRRGDDGGLGNPGGHLDEVGVPGECSHIDRRTGRHEDASVTGVDSADDRVEDVGIAELGPEVT